MAIGWNDFYADKREGWAPRREPPVRDGQDVQLVLKGDITRRFGRVLCGQLVARENNVHSVRVTWAGAGLGHLVGRLVHVPDRFVVSCLGIEL